MIIDSQAIVRNNKRDSLYLLTFPSGTSYKPVSQPDTDIYPFTYSTFLSPKDPLNCSSTAISPPAPSPVFNPWQPRICSPFS